eukprot:PhM_4_TR14945/c0_g1_i1/m.72302
MSVRFVALFVLGIVFFATLHTACSAQQQQTTTITQTPPPKTTAVEFTTVLHNTDVTELTAEGRKQFSEDMVHEFTRICRVKRTNVIVYFERTQEKDSLDVRCHTLPVELNRTLYDVSIMTGLSQFRENVIISYRQASALSGVLVRTDAYVGRTYIKLGANLWQQMSKAAERNMPVVVVGLASMALVMFVAFVL